MPEIERTRNLVIFKTGDIYAVAISADLASAGWLGGQGMQWFDSTRDEMTVEGTDGAGQGFMLWGSDEDSDEFTAMTRNQPHYRFGVLGFGGWLFSTTTFEKYTWASRQVGPLIPIVYTAQDDLVFSLRGRWTNEDEWTLAGDGRAPNENVMGVVVQPPSIPINNYLTIQARI